MTGVLDASARPRAAECPRTAPGGPRSGRSSRAWTPLRIVGVSSVMILAQALIRAWTARTGVLSQDDLVVAGRSARQPVLSSEFLLADEKRFAPLADLLTAGLTRLAPLEYWPMAATLVLFQVVASLAVLRLLRLLLGNRPVLLLPLVVYLFSPLGLPALDNWTTAVSAVSFQAALAWVCGDAIALARTGRRRHAVSGTLVLAIGLLFGTRAVVIPVVAFAVVAVALRQSGEGSPVVAAARRGLWLWAGLVAVSSVIAWRFGAAVRPPTVPADRSGSLSTALDAVGRSVVDGIMPALIGGPLYWSDFGTWADPPTPLVVAALAAAVVAVSWTSWRKQGCGVVWALLTGYIGASVLLLVIGRLSTGTTAEFALGLTFFPDLVLVVAIALALVARAPAREPARRVLLNSTERRDAAVVLAVFFVGLSLWSTATYHQTRDHQPVLDYLAAARQSLEEADAPVLDHPVDDSVVWGLSAPYNRVSWVFAPVGAETSTSTDDARVLGPDGVLVDARVEPQSASVPGSRPDCGHFVEPLASTTIGLARPVGEASWTVELNYLASSDGWILVHLGNGDAEVAPVRQGANVVFLSLHGDGDRITVGSETAGMAFCISTARVGVLQADD